MNYFKVLINHPKATPARIEKMIKNGWTIKEIAEKLRDGKFSIDHVKEHMDNQPRAYYVLNKLSKDGIIEKVAKSGSRKTHYQFKVKK